MSNRFFEENILENNILDPSEIEQNYDSDVQYEYCAISGKVIDKYSRVPLSGVSVETESYGTKITDSNGFFEFPFNEVRYIKGIELQSKKFTIPAVENENLFKNEILNGMGISEENKVTWTVDITRYKNSKTYNTNNGRTNIILEVEKSYLETSDGLINLAEKDKLVIKILKSSIDFDCSLIDKDNCCNYFTLTFYEYLSCEGDEITNTTVKDDSWYSGNNALINVYSVTKDNNYLTFTFDKYNGGTPKIYDIGVLEVNNGQYAQCKFQINKNVEIVDDQQIFHVNQVMILSLQKKSAVINNDIIIYLKCVDANSGLPVNKPTKNIKIYRNGQEVSFNTQPGEHDSDFIIVLDASTGFNTYDLIVIDADDFFANSIILVEKPNPDDNSQTYGQSSTINFVYGDPLNGSTISNDEQWNLWSIYAIPWYENVVDIKFNAKDINTGDDKEFIDTNVSIYSIRNVSREIDGANIEQKYLVENNIKHLDNMVDCNQIILSRSKTIANKQYIFNIPLYQQCYPAQMIFKVGNSTSIDIHRYVNSEINIKYRTLNNNNDIYKSSFENDTDIKITYKNSDNSRGTIVSTYESNFNNFVIANDDTKLHFGSEDISNSREMKVLLRGNLGNIRYNNVFFEPYISDTTKYKSIVQNIGLVSSIYSTMICHNENFLLKSNLQNPLEYTFGYSYGVNLPLGEYSCIFEQDDKISNIDLAENNKHQYTPKIIFDGNNDNFEITNTKLVSKKNWSSPNNTFSIISDNTQYISISYSYESNVPNKDLNVAYKVVSNPECVIEGISFIYDNNTYSINVGNSITYTEKYFSGAVNSGTISGNDNLFFVSTANISEESNIDNSVTIGISENGNTYADITSEGLTIYNSYVLSTDDNKIYYKLSNGNDFILPGNNEVIINGKDTLSDIICYASRKEDSSLTSKYNANRIISTVEAGDLGYIYKLNNNSDIYSSGEIENDINKYYFVSNNDIQPILEVNYTNITEGLSVVHTLNPSLTADANIIQSIENNKIVSINKGNDESGIYAELLNLPRKNERTNTQINNIIVCDSSGTDICVTDYNNIVNAVSSTGHQYICEDIDANTFFSINNANTFQKNYGWQCSSGNNGVFELGYNDSPTSIDAFINNYRNYIISTVTNEHATIEQNHSYDYSPLLNDINNIDTEIVNQYINLYIDGDPYYITGNRNSLSLQSSQSFYNKFIKPYEQIRSDNENHILYSYYINQNDLNKQTPDTLHDYFASYGLDDDYKTSNTYIERQYYAYGITYSYLYNIAKYDDNGIIKVRPVNYSNTSVTYFDGSNIGTRSQDNTLSSDERSIRYGIVDGLLNFISNNYNNTMLAEYNEYFAYNGNDLTVSDIAVIFNDNIRLIDLTTSDNIYKQYSDLITVFNNQISLKLTNGNYSTICSNIDNNVSVVNFCKDLYNNINTLFKETVGQNISSINILTKCDNNINTAWEKILDLLKYFKTNNTSTTTILEGIDYYELSVTTVNNILVSSGASKIFVRKSIYDTYKDYNNSILDNLKDTSNNDNNSICNTITSNGVNYSNIKPVVNDLIDIIKKDCKNIVDRFNDFKPELLTIHADTNQIINKILSTTGSSNINVTLYIKNYEYFKNYNLIDLAGIDNYIKQHGFEILIHKYLIRAYNYSIIQEEEAAQISGEINTRCSGVNNDSITAEINAIRNYLKNRILDLKNNYANISIKVKLNGDLNPRSISRFNPSIENNIKNLNLVTKHYYGYNLYYFNNLDFITGENGLYIKYLLSNSSSENINANDNRLQIFNGTLKIENSSEQYRWLYMYLFYYDKIYKQLKFSVNGYSSIQLDTNLNTLPKMQSISRTITSDNVTNQIHFNFETTNLSLSAGYSAKMIFDYKKYNDVNWQEKQYQINSVKNASFDIPKTNYDDINIFNNIYLLRYKLEYYINNEKYSNSNYVYYVYLQDNPSNYQYNKINIMNSGNYYSEIDGTGIIYLKTQESGNSAYWWYATTANNFKNPEDETIDCLKFYMLDGIYKYNTNISDYELITSNTVSPAVGSNYYKSWRYLYYYDDVNINKYDLSK